MRKRPLAELQAELKSSIKELEHIKYAMFKGYMTQSEYGRLRFAGRLVRRSLQERIVKTKQFEAQLKQEDYERRESAAAIRANAVIVREITRGFEEGTRNRFNIFYENGGKL